MTAVANICERWAMRMDPPTEDNPWYMEWVLKSPGQISKSVTAGWHAYSSLRSRAEVFSAWEPFGGIGAQSLIIRELFHPPVHVVSDYAPGAVDHLRRELPEDVDVHRADAYGSAPFRADLVGLDFGDLTVWKTREGERHRKFLDDVFARGPHAVVITDVAGPRLGLHRARYETLLGEGSCADYPTYLRAFTDRLAVLYGYSLHRGYYHHGAAKMALLPFAGDGTLEPTPTTPIGIELL